jgi:hypothetical protein
MQRSLNLLDRRIRELDEMPLWSDPAVDSTLSKVQRSMSRQISHFANILAWYTDTFIEEEAGYNALIDSVKADEAVARSRLLQEIAKDEPELISGPLRVDRQHWVRTGRHDLLPDGDPIAPCESRFVAPSAPNEDVGIKPFHRGFYTSTVTIAGCSMWRSLMGSTGSMMYPWPWYTWKLNVDDSAKIAEIVSASHWTEFVCRHSQIQRGLLYPDWFKVAENFDAVHFTLPMIAATQGFSIVTSRGSIAPGFWDVETTFWLKWCFSGARLVETVSA